jgi:hypothetical protein
LHKYPEVPRYRIVTAWELSGIRVLPTAVFCEREEISRLTEHGPEVFLTRLREAAQ